MTNLKKMTQSERVTLLFVLRSRFDNKNVSEKEAKEILSISIKLGLPQFFIDQLIKDLKV